MQTRSLVNHRPQRNLLLLVDGKKSEEQLLASVTGIGKADLDALRELGLISSADASGPASSAVPASTSAGAASASSSSPVREASASAVAVAEAPPVVVPPRPEAGPTPMPMPTPDAAYIDIPIDEVRAQPSFDHVSKTLTSLISSELGLRGFTLTLAVERATGIEALLDVADRVLGQIESRKGMAAADKARRTLFGR